MRNPNMHTKQRRERHAANMPNITMMYPYTWLHPNKPPKGMMQPNKQVALKTNKQQTHKGNKTNTCQRPRSKQTSMDPNMNTRKRANKAQTCIKELIQTLY